MKKFFSILTLSLASLTALAGGEQFGLVKLSVAQMRTKPGHAQELSTQSLMGMPVKLSQHADGYWLAETPEGYTSYINDSSVQLIDSAEFARWRRAQRLVVTDLYQQRAYADSVGDSPRQIVTDLVNGNIVEGPLRQSSGRTEVRLPDGRTGWVDSQYLTPIAQWADQPFDAQKILDIAYSMEGEPYLWGGTSVKSSDCSGLSKVGYLYNGRILLRNASQQARTGTRIEAKDWRKCQAGDLLFFGNPNTGKVTHVAIYDRDGWYVHSSGRVKRNSVDPKSPGYLTTPFLHAVRIAGNEGTNGIIKVIDHPWYF